MEVFILDPVVRQNVRLLMHIIQDALKQSEGDVKKAERVYSLMVNRKTGEFQEVNEPGVCQVTGKRSSSRSRDKHKQDAK